MSNSDARSTFVSGLGWLTLVFAVLGLVGTGFTEVEFEALRSSPDFQALLKTPVDGMSLVSLLHSFEVWFFPVMVVHVIYQGAMLALGWGMIKRREWARKGMVINLWLTLILTVGGSLAQGGALARLSSVYPAAELGVDLDKITSTLKFFSFAVALVFAVIFGLLIRRLGRPEVRREFGDTTGDGRPAI